MSITTAQILSEVNDRLNRSETDIDAQIRACLYNISSRGNFLSKEYTKDTVAEQAYYALPDNYKEMKAIKLIDSDDDEKEPLVGPIEFKEYLEIIASDTNDDEPQKFSIFNEFYWLTPTPDDTYDIRLYCHIYHPYSLDTILFNEDFREVIYAGSCFEVAKNYGLEKKMAEWGMAYEQEVQIKLGNISEKLPILTSKFHDV